MPPGSPNQTLALPPSASAPGVLVLHAWWGLNDFTRQFCHRLAHEGYTVLAPDLFSGRIAHTPAEAEQLVNQVGEEQTVPSALLAAADALRRHPATSAGRLAIVGFSFGAFWALWLAQRQPEWVQAVTLFYGTNGGEGDFTQSSAAFLGHFAENDPFEGAELVQATEQALRGANRPVSFYTYPGAGHWFFEQDRPDAFDAPSAQLAWERTTAFLHEQFKSSAG